MYETTLQAHSQSQRIHRSQFSNVVFCVRDVAGFDLKNKTYAKPTLALRLGHSLKACAMELRSQAMICGNRVLKDLYDEFYDLCP
jgi:hypothetical protein